MSAAFSQNRSTLNPDPGPANDATREKQIPFRNDTPELWDQRTGTARKAPEIPLGDGRSLVPEYT